MELAKTTSTSTTTTTSKYIRDFESLFVPIKVEQLRDKARNGNLRHSQFRSLCWRYFLHCLPEQYDQWLSSCSKSRQKYEEIQAKHLALRQSGGGDENDDNNQDHQQSKTPSPTDQQEQEAIGQEHDLSKQKEIAKRNRELEEEQQYARAANQCDYKNVLRTIERDVVRTFPDMEFFRQTEMQGILERVLFNYASENSHLSYKQGMHELLATLLYVLHTDSQNCLINYQGGYANQTIGSLLDLRFLEHDTYQLFSALMKSIETWYQNDEILIATTEPSSSNSGGRQMENSSSSHHFHNRSTTNRHQQVSSVLGMKLKMISENIVKNYDLELFNHLEALQIAPQIYGIRWMRLLFGREFEFLDLLTVWDAIICDQVSMSLTNYIFASMLITIREELVNGDYTDCLNSLMRHQFKDVQYVIKLALHLRNPKNYSRPPKQSVSGIRKNFSQILQQHQHNRRTQSPETSLTSRLSQQYISVKQQIQQANSRYEQWSSSSHHGTSSSSNQRGLAQQHQQQKQLLSQQQQKQNQQQQYHHRTSVNHQHSLVASPTNEESPVKEYEMREMHTSSSSGSLQRKSQPSKNNMSIGNIYGKESKNALANMSTESYEDLHSIVDYCWRLLSEQIDSLQRCLPKEKSLHSEDEIFVALAQLKKVRDVLKGSLRLEDELDSAHPEGKVERK